MTETRAIAHLPTLDIEFVRRELPNEGAEQIGRSVLANRVTFRSRYLPRAMVLNLRLVERPVILLHPAPSNDEAS